MPRLSGNQRSKVETGETYHKWIAIDAGGTSQRLNPALAMTFSFIRKEINGGFIRHVL
jgi:hypothetical protein